MNGPDMDREYVRRLVELLRTRFGPSEAMTIDALRIAAGIRCRRDCEKLLELYLSDFPFPVISGASGYFRPQNADELNRYLASLVSRIKCLALRHRTVRRLAIAANWKHGPRLFLDCPASQTEFSFPSPSPIQSFPPAASLPAVANNSDPASVIANVG